MHTDLSERLCDQDQLGRSARRQESEKKKRLSMGVQDQDELETSTVVIEVYIALSRQEGYDSVGFGDSQRAKDGRKHQELSKTTEATSSRGSS